jgi:hypothetical protein
MPGVIGRLEKEIAVIAHYFAKNIILHYCKIFISVNRGVEMVNIVGHIIALQVKLSFAALANRHTEKPHSIY